VDDNRFSTSGFCHAPLHPITLDEDGDPIDVNIVKPVGAVSGASGGAPAGKKVWPKTLHLFRKALTETAINSGVAYRIPSGPAVMAVKADDARAQYIAAYPHGGTASKDPEARKEAASASWRRHYKAATEGEFAGYRSEDEEDWLWDAV
jgi:hypothetical protein